MLLNLLIGLLCSLPTEERFGVRELSLGTWKVYLVARGCINSCNGSFRKLS